MKSPIKEITCDSISKLDKQLNKYLDKHENYIFRGQYNSNWDIFSSFQRFIGQNNNLNYMMPDPFDRLIKIYKPQLEIRLNKKLDNIDEYICYAQHYGLPTPYIDWSLRKDKALFFSFCDETQSQQCHEYASLYALRIKHIEDLTDHPKMKEFIIKEKGFELFEKNGISLVTPSILSPNERIKNQEGLFLKVTGIVNMNSNLINVFEDIYSCYNFNKPIIYKFNFPRKEAISSLKKLHNDSGINFSYLFPDHEGIAKQAKFEFILENTLNI